MINSEELNNKRITSNTQDIKQTQEVKPETRLNQINSNSPEILTITFVSLKTCLICSFACS
mgnify:CR=1 FL=1